MACTYSIHIHKHEIVCLENMWRQRIARAWKHTLHRLFANVFPDDVINVIADHVAPSVVGECLYVTADATTVTYEIL